MTKTFYAELAVQTGLLYGVFVAVGGTIGYVKAGSLVSLYCGLTAGAIACASSWVAKKYFLDIGLKVLLGTALLLAIVFHKRYQESKEFMPAGFMAFNSAGIVIISVLALKSTAVSTASLDSQKKK